jgi:predicted CXXCH cytochrome family protein
MAARHAFAAGAALLLASTPVGAAPRGLAPIPRGEAVSTHGPFEAGECKACHAGTNARPGKVRVSGNALCFECHEEFKKPVASHTDDPGACTGCHSPHNARKPKLVL